MCLIVCAFHYQPRYPLVIAANRDEFYSRPTRDAHFWSLKGDQPDLLAGQDLSKGGTWLGLTRDGRFAAVTNIRSPNPKTSRMSRGDLTRRFLLGDQPPADYLARVQDSLTEYAGFNLLVGDRQSLYFLNSDDGEIRNLQPGIYGLSNGTLDSDWPKIRHSRSALRNLLDQDQALDTASVISIMMDEEPADERQLPETGVSRELERLLSPVFIRNPQRNYGTRCSTAVIVDQRGMVRFCEQNYGADTKITARQYFQFSLYPQDVGRVPAAG